jgi:hypothetical protein
MDIISKRIDCTSNRYKWGNDFICFWSFWCPIYLPFIRMGWNFTITFKYIDSVIKQCTFFILLLLLFPCTRLLSDSTSDFCHLNWLLIGNRYSCSLRVRLFFWIQPSLIVQELDIFYNYLSLLSDICTCYHHLLIEWIGVISVIFKDNNLHILWS